MASTASISINAYSIKFGACYASDFRDKNTGGPTEGTLVAWVCSAWRPRVMASPHHHHQHRHHEPPRCQPTPRPALCLCRCRHNGRRWCHCGGGLLATWRLRRTLRLSKEVEGGSGTKGRMTATFSEVCACLGVAIIEVMEGDDGYFQRIYFPWIME